MRKRIGYGIVCCFLCISAFYMMYQWKELNVFGNQAGLRYESSGLSVSQIEGYYKRQEEKKGAKEDEVYPVEITAWKMEKDQSVCQKNTRQQAVANVVKIYGNMARVLPFSIKYGGFTVAEDKNSCIISTGLAWKLFGAEKVTGNILQYQGEEFKVRGVLSTDELILALYQRNEQEIMPYVEVWQDGQSPAAQLEQIQSGLGLYEASYTFAGSFFISSARLIMSLMYWVIFLYLCKRGIMCYKNSKWKYQKIMDWGGRLLILFGIAAGLWLSISFTRDFIPVQWSDFGFWKEKWQMIFADFKERGQFPKIYWEQQVLERIEKIGLATGITIIVLYINCKNTDGIRKY